MADITRVPWLCRIVCHQLTAVPSERAKKARGSYRVLQKLSSVIMQNLKLIRLLLEHTAQNLGFYLSLYPSVFESTEFLCSIDSTIKVSNLRSCVSGSLMANHFQKK